jgi:hypothetical protein
MRLLLDGSKIKEKTFDKQFKKIVGTSFGVWIKREGIKKGG